MEFNNWTSNHIILFMIQTNENISCFNYASTLEKLKETGISHFYNKTVRSLLCSSVRHRIRFQALFKQWFGTSRLINECDQQSLYRRWHLLIPNWPFCGCSEFFNQHVSLLNRNKTIIIATTTTKMWHDIDVVKCQKHQERRLHLKYYFNI